MARCPRVPRHIRPELEEIYKRGPVEAAMKLASNALQTVAPATPLAAPETGSTLPAASNDG